jgi:aminoglycoside phosphotransferase family enzyme/predicted kinase
MSAFPDHLQALLYPRAYPHPVQAVELIETHVSWVLLTGEFAYKIKRPVCYPFIDLRSPERRAFLCHEEIRLNRRFAPELYLGVCPVSYVEGEAHLEGSGRVIEHAVRMRQFPREDELEQLLEARLIEPAELESFGRELARIHARLPVPRPAQSWGRPPAQRALIIDNAAECARVGESLGASADLRTLQADLEVVLDKAMQTLSARFTAGRVRECHADLHARNIVRREARLLAFDCLEFDPALRWIDVADEISFLLADLDSRQKTLHAQAFLAGYLAESGDYQACVLLPLFKAHRALVRAKITVLSATEAKAGGRDKPDARRQFEAYVEYARRSLVPKSPILILMSGLSGSGKTWIAQRLAPRLLGIHLRSDIERRRMAGLSGADRSDSGVEEGLYSREVTVEVYRQLAHCAQDILAGGYPTIVDATFGRRADRAHFHELSARLGVKVCIVHCHAPRHVLQARIVERRQRKDDASEADLSVLAWQETHFEPISAQEAFMVLEATTTEPDAVDRLVERIGALNA